IVSAVQEARLAASSSWGLGPVSSPPLSSGSSAGTWCSRISTSCWKVLPSRRAVALMWLILAWLFQRIEEEPGWDLGIEEGRLRGHRLARLGHALHLLDRGGPEDEGGVRAAL